MKSLFLRQALFLWQFELLRQTKGTQNDKKVDFGFLILKKRNPLLRDYLCLGSSKTIKISLKCKKSHPKSINLSFGFLVCHRQYKKGVVSRKKQLLFTINNGYYIFIIDSSQLAFFSTPSKSATVAAMLESPKEPSLTV